MGVQFHPEYLSHPLHPSAPYLGLVLAASGQLKDYLSGTRIPSPLNSIMDLSYKFSGFLMNNASPRRVSSKGKMVPKAMANGFGNGYANGHHSSDDDLAQYSTSI